MCTENVTQSKYKLNITVLYFIFIILGIITGLSDIVILHDVAAVISEIFIKIFKFISLPIISLSLIVTLSQVNADKEMNKAWQKTLFYTITTTIIAASVAFILYLIIAPANIITQPKSIDMPIASSTNYLVYLMKLVPENILAPFLEHQVIGVLLVSIIVGIAIRYIPDGDAQKTIGGFFKGIHGVFLVITGWVVKIIPIALYGFIATTIMQFKGGMDFAGLSGYLMVVVLANIVQGFIVLPIFLSIYKIQPFMTLRSMMPALSVAFFSKSSAGTLPVTMQTAENNLNVSPKISRFVLPLCTSINMNGCAAFIFTTVIYIMQNNGIEVSLMTMLLWIIIATIAAIGNAGVPMGCFFLSISLLTSMNVPVALLSVILPFYSIIDMIETALNVWSDSCVAVVVDKQTKQAI
ncbi:Glutamate-aspartate carrier protein [Rickettsiales bacterium Ac37b]|nr:Glutamate-aspartate carrier protein [Rickettsiales bacterium Ac37b]